jgi:hypothetical protein
MGKGGGDTSCIIHSLVAYEEKILASCSSPLKESAYDAQVCSVLSEKVLKKICARMHNHKKTYITEKYVIHHFPSFHSSSGPFFRSQLINCSSPPPPNSSVRTDTISTT